MVQKLNSVIKNCINIKTCEKDRVEIELRHSGHTVYIGVTYIGTGLKTCAQTCFPAKFSPNTIDNLT